MRESGRLTRLRKVGTASAVLLSLAVAMPPVSGAEGDLRRFVVVENVLSGTRNLHLSPTSATRLDTIRPSLVVPLPDLDMGSALGLRVLARTVGGTPSGRLRVAVFRERDGQPREFLGRERDRLQSDQFSPVASVEFSFPGDQFAAGDTLVLRTSFSGDAELAAGDSLRLSASWFTANLAAGRRGEPAGPSEAVGEARASNDLDVELSNLEGARQVVLNTTNTTRLSRLDETFEMPIPDLTTGPDANTLLLQADALILSLFQEDSPDGRMRIVFWRLPADGGPPELLNRSSAKLSFFRAGVGLQVPIPAGLGLGDRIVARLFFKTDWRFQAAFGTPSVTLNASWSLTEGS